MKNIALILIGSLLTFGGQAYVRSRTPPKAVEQVVTVYDGATYWGYAEEYCPRQISKGEYVHEVRKLNGMKELQSGDDVIILKYEEE